MWRLKPNVDVAYLLDLYHDAVENVAAKLEAILADVHLLYGDAIAMRLREDIQIKDEFILAYVISAVCFESMRVCLSDFYFLMIGGIHFVEYLSYRPLCCAILSENVTDDELDNIVSAAIWRLYGYYYATEFQFLISVLRKRYSLRESFKMVLSGKHSAFYSWGVEGELIEKGLASGPQDGFENKGKFFFYTS